MLRVRGRSATWVFRFTAPSGWRREMSLGGARRGTPKEAGESLKTIAEAHGLKPRKHRRGHNLLTLYGDLPGTAQAEISAALPEHAIAWRLQPEIDLRKLLTGLEDAFERWRYIYETGSAPAVRISETIVAILALRKTAREAVKRAEEHSGR